MSRFMHAIRSSAAALALAVISTGSASAEEAKLKSIAFNAGDAIGPLRVISTDGQTWNALAGGAVQFPASLSVDTKWPGFVDSVGVVLGQCGNASCKSLPLMWSALVAQRDFSDSANIFIMNGDIPLSDAGGIAVITEGDSVLSRCNQHLQPDGPTKSYSFTAEFRATMIVDTEKATLDSSVIGEVPGGAWPTFDGDVDHTKSDSFSVQVICDPVRKKPVADDLASDQGDFGVEAVRLFLTTYQNKQPGSNPGTVCPALKVTSRAETSKAGPVSMRIWRQKNGGAITSSFQQAWASYDAAKNGYFATYETVEAVGTTSHFQFKTEIEDGTPFAPFDGWKDITVHCTGAGGGGLTTEDRPSQSAPLPVPVRIIDRQPQCGPDQMVVKNRCVDRPPVSIFCQKGFVLVGKQCVKKPVIAVACRKDEIRVDGRCIRKPGVSIHCLPGYVQKGLKCVKKPVIVQACKRNEVRVDGRCVKKPEVSILCKKGYRLVGKTCVRIPAIAQGCKRGERLVGGRCVAKPAVKALVAKRLKPEPRPHVQPKPRRALRVN